MSQSDWEQFRQYALHEMEHADSALRLRATPMAVELVRRHLERVLRGLEVFKEKAVTE